VNRPSLTCVQASRGLAALSVAAYHLAIIAGPQGSPLFDGWFSFGRLGVDFFFVLSGFIILHAHAEDIGHPSRLSRYATKRFTRIYPIYWAILVVAIVAHRLFHLGRWNWLTSFTLLHFTDYGTPLVPAWTLFHEVLFYAVFGVLIASRKWGFALLAAWGVAIVARHHYPRWQEFSASDTVLALYNLDFFLGMGVYMFHRYVRQPAAVLAASLLGVAALSVYEHAAAVEIYPLRLAYGALFAGTLAALVQLEQTRALAASALLVLLGDASYALYLVHDDAAKAMVHRLGIAHPVALFPVMLAAICAAAILVHLWVERPLLRTLRGGRFTARQPLDRPRAARRRRRPAHHSRRHFASWSADELTRSGCQRRHPTTRERPAVPREPEAACV